MKKGNMLFIVLFALIFVPIITMLVMTGVALADDVPRPLEAPRPEPLIEPEPTNTPVPEPAIISDSINTASFIIPMRAGESRTLPLTISTEEAKTLELVQTLVVSDITNLDDIPNDDWVYSEDELIPIQLDAGEIRTFEFNLNPLDDVPAGLYEFHYELRAGDEVIKTVEIKVTILE